MNNPMMKCGHAANSTSNGRPACVICAPNPKAYQIDDNPPLLEGRMARCSYYGKRPSGRNHEGDNCKRGEICKCEKPSNSNLAFFTGHPDKDYDEFYCGCWGWD